MATIKLKYRPSTVRGNEGTLFFQIIHRREVRQIYTGVHVDDSEWDATAAAVVVPADTCTRRVLFLASALAALEEWRRRLEAAVAELDARCLPYSARDVAEASAAPALVAGLVSFARSLVSELRTVGKNSAARRFKATLNSLLRYTAGAEIAWERLTSTFILGYEEFLRKRGLCRNSTSFYMRNLRAIVNRAAEKGFEVPHNPFRYVYMGVDKTVKRAVGLDVIRRIRDIDLERYPSLDFARKVFMFAFYTRGMSFVDIAFLRKSDMRNGILTYSRRKTRRQLAVRIEPETRRIIDSFGKNESDFLLPIITDADTDADRQYEQAYFRINRNIQKVGTMLGLETKLTLYVARHAWASIAQANNVALSTISKAMGHESEKTTIIYLQQLDTTSVDRANSKIIRMMDSGKRKR